MPRIVGARLGSTLARAAVVLGCIAALGACGDAASGGAAAKAADRSSPAAVVPSAPVAAAPHVETRAADPRAADLRGADASPGARRVADWAVRTNDHGGRPFAVVDKRRAEVLVFSASGVLVGASPALLGSARGDDTLPGVGEKAIDAVLPHERTTPAGRFVVEQGINAKGKPVVWIDYDAAVSMHAVVTEVASQRRLARLASIDAADNRISYGCVNLPQTFFDAVALPAFSGNGGIVYVLPEVRRLEDVFPGLDSVGDRFALRSPAQKGATPAR